MTGEEYQHGKQLQSANQHKERTDKFGESGHNGVIHGRAKEMESRTNVTQTGCGCRETGDKVISIQ